MSYIFIYSILNDQNDEFDVIDDEKSDTSDERKTRTKLIFLISCWILSKSLRTIAISTFKMKRSSRIIICQYSYMFVNFKMTHIRDQKLKKRHCDRKCKIRKRSKRFSRNLKNDFQNNANKTFTKIQHTLSRVF